MEPRALELDRARSLRLASPQCRVRSVQPELADTDAADYIDLGEVATFEGPQRDQRVVLTLSRVALNRMPNTPAATRTTPAISAPWIGGR